MLFFSNSSRGNLSIWWSLVQRNKDIAGFYIAIRNSRNEILVEHHVPYESRIDNIVGSNICQQNCQNLELCIISKNSAGSVNGWFDSQCINLPDDFKSIQEEYTIYNDRIYVIQSLRKKTRAHVDHNHNWNKSMGVSIWYNFSLHRNVILYSIIFCSSYYNIF